MRSLLTNDIPNNIIRGLWDENNYDNYSNITGLFSLNRFNTARWLISNKIETLDQNLDIGIVVFNDDVNVIKWLRNKHYKFDLKMKRIKIKNVAFFKWLRESIDINYHSYIISKIYKSEIVIECLLLGVIVAICLLFAFINYWSC